MRAFVWTIAFTMTFTPAPTRAQDASEPAADFSALHARVGDSVYVTEPSRPARVALRERPRHQPRDARRAH